MSLLWPIIGPYYWAILSKIGQKRTILEDFAYKTSFSFRLKHETLYNYGLGNSYRNWKGTQAVGHPYDLFLGHFKPYQLDINWHFFVILQITTFIDLWDASNLQHTFPYGYEYIYSDIIHAKCNLNITFGGLNEAKISKS